MLTYYPDTRRIYPGPWPHFRVIADKELEDRDLIFAIRNTCFEVSRTKELMPGDWLTFLTNTYHHLKVMMVDINGRPLWLNTDVFEASDEEIDADMWPTITRRRREFFEYNCCRAANENGGNVEKAWRRQFLVMASIVGAAMLEEAGRWPRRTVVRAIWDIKKPANDNRPQNQRIGR